MRTLIRGGYVVGFNGKGHEILKDGVVVYAAEEISPWAFPLRKV